MASADGTNFFDSSRKALRVGDKKSYIDWNNEQPDSLIPDNATIRKKLNVDGEALVSSGFYFSNDDIKSKSMIGENPAIELNGKYGYMTFSSLSENWLDEECKGKISILPASGVVRIETQNTADKTHAYAELSSEGIFCNRAECDALPGSSGITIRGAVVGLGHGKVESSNTLGLIDKYLNAVVEVYGNADNEFKEYEKTEYLFGGEVLKVKHSAAPAYGGYFCNLMASGLNVSVKVMGDSAKDGYNIEPFVSQVIRANNVPKTVFLLQGGHYIGKVIYVKSLFSTVIVRPPEGVRIWTKEKRTDYYVNAGEEARFIYVNLGKEWKLWVCSCYSFT